MWAGCCIAAAAGAQDAASTARVAAAPRSHGHLTAADIGLVINTADPYSEAVGRYYIKKRRLKPEQVLRVEVPVKPSLDEEEFDALQRSINEHFGVRTQALALAWTQPYAVRCNAITGALALGYDPALCEQTCGRSRESRYFNTATFRPYAEVGVRPSMLLAAASVAQARELIDRGVAADHSLGLRGAPPALAYYLATHDAARNVRAPWFPPAGPIRRLGVDVLVEQGDELRPHERLLVVQTGLAQLEHLDQLGFVNGALADHLTSYGGQIDRQGGQTTALAWIDAGATASYGTVSEPCNHLQKFPHPQLLLLHYLQGETAIEAYWKSVAWPQQGLFIGEPLAAPFAH